MVVVLGTLLAVGILQIGRILQGSPLIPTAATRLIQSASKSQKVGGGSQTALTTVLVFVVVLLVTRMLPMAVVAGAAVVLWPMVVGGGKAERAELAKLEALAQWTESLRDLAQKGAGLESLIPRTTATASDILHEPLRRLSGRLAVRVPLPQALSLFADEVDHASADLVVGALAMSARQRKGQLSRVLGALSASLRDELEQRTKIMRERNGIRREAAQVAALTAIIVGASALMKPPTVGDSATTSTAEHVLPFLLAVGMVLVFSQIRRLAEPRREARFLSAADDVLEAATHRPTRLQL